MLDFKMEFGAPANAPVEILDSGMRHMDRGANKASVRNSIDAVAQIADCSAAISADQMIVKPARYTDTSTKLLHLEWGPSKFNITYNIAVEKWEMCQVKNIFM